jgi:hypothetical protein
MARSLVAIKNSGDEKGENPERKHRFLSRYQLLGWRKQPFFLYFKKNLRCLRNTTKKLSISRFSGNGALAE